MGTTKKNTVPRTTIYTVSSIDDTVDDPMDFDVIGSYVSRGAAIRECANYILDRMQWRPDIRDAVLYDENHRNLLDALKEQFNMEWVERVLSYPDTDFSWEENESYQDLRQFLFDYFVDEIGGQACYIIYSSTYGTFRFDVTENDVEGVGDAWTCITSGKSDNDDEEFEQPFPEVFLSHAEALKCALDDLAGYLDGTGPRHIQTILKDARLELTRHGNFSYELDGCGAVRRWDIWYTPIPLAGEIAHIQTRRTKGTK